MLEFNSNVHMILNLLSHLNLLVKQTQICFTFGKSVVQINRISKNGIRNIY